MHGHSFVPKYIFEMGLGFGILERRLDKTLQPFLLAVFVPVVLPFLL